MHVHTRVHAHVHTHGRESRERKKDEQKREHREVPSPFLPGPRQDRRVPVLRGPALELQAFPPETQLCSSPIQPSNPNMFL